MKRSLAAVALALACTFPGSVWAQGVLYEEDFSDGVADGFLFTDDSWWVADGHLNCYLEGMEIYSMGHVPSSTWTDYRYDVDLRTFGSINHMVRFRIQDEGEFYEINMRAQPYNDVFLQKYEDGQMTILTGVAFVSQPGEWHHFSVEALGPRIAVRLNDTDVIAYVDDMNPYLWGGVGVACFTGGVIQWQEVNADNFRVAMPVIPTDPTTWGRIKQSYR